MWLTDGRTDRRGKDEVHAVCREITAVTKPVSLLKESDCVSLEQLCESCSSCTADRAEFSPSEAHAAHIQKPPAVGNSKNTEAFLLVRGVLWRQRSSASKQTAQPTYRNAQPVGRSSNTLMCPVSSFLWSRHSFLL